MPSHFKYVISKVMYNFYNQSLIFRCLVKLKPEIGVSAFVPYACDVVDELLTEDMINQEQLIDEELKFNMLILAEVSL